MRSLLPLLLVFAAVAIVRGQPLNLRVIWTTNPQTEAVVAWDSRGGADARLHVRASSLLTAGQLDQSLREKTGLKALTMAYTDQADGCISQVHQVRLSGLQPSTTYQLVAECDGVLGEEHHFRTAPDGDQPFKIFFVGDSRTLIEATRRVSREIGEAFEQDDQFIALLHGGDFTDTPRIGLWERWLEAYSLTTTRAGRLLPIIPVRGNHETQGHPMFDEAYGAPGGAVDNWYTCMLSPDVGLIVLNTNTSAAGGQRDFLIRELETMKRQKVRFQMAAYHRPLVPAVKQPAAAGQVWIPIFEEYRIDLGLESDGHCIKRTVPILDGAVHPDGVVYLGEGGYGAPQRDVNRGHWYLQGDQAFAGRGDHYMVLAFSGDAIDYRTIRSGEVVDQAGFRARERSTTPRQP